MKRKRRRKRNGTIVEGMLLLKSVDGTFLRLPISLLAEFRVHDENVVFILYK